MKIIIFVSLILLACADAKGQNNYLIVGKSKILFDRSQYLDLRIVNSIDSAIAVPEFQQRASIVDMLGRYSLKIYRPSTKITVDHSGSVHLDSINNPNYLELIINNENPIVKGFEYFHISNDKITRREYEISTQIAEPKDFSRIIFSDYANLKRGDLIIIRDIEFLKECESSMINATIMFKVE